MESCKKLDWDVEMFQWKYPTALIWFDNWASRFAVVKFSVSAYWGKSYLWEIYYFCFWIYYTYKYVHSYMADRSHLFTFSVTHGRVSDLYLDLRQGVYFPVGDGPGVMFEGDSLPLALSDGLHHHHSLRFLANCNEHRRPIYVPVVWLMLNPLRFFFLLLSLLLF